MSCCACQLTRVRCSACSRTTCTLRVLRSTTRHLASLATDLLLGRRSRELAANPLRILPAAVDGVARRAARRRLVPPPAESASTPLTPELLVEHVRGRPGATELKVSWVPADGGPEPFYRSLGFEPTGEEDGGEVVARLALA